MNDNSKRFLFGGLLVLAGVVFILQQLFNWPIGGVFISLLFAAGAFVFLFVFLRNRSQWWALIPGMTLLGLALVIATGDLVPEIQFTIWGHHFPRVDRTGIHSHLCGQARFLVGCYPCRCFNHDRTHDGHPG